MAKRKRIEAWAAYIQLASASSVVARSNRRRNSYLYGGFCNENNVWRLLVWLASASGLGVKYKAKKIAYLARRIRKLTEEAYEIESVEM